MNLAISLLWLIPVIGLCTVVLGAISLASSLVDRSGRVPHACARLWARLILLVSRTQLEVYGAAPADGTCVYASNHQSLYDIPILFCSIPRQLRIIAKASLGRVPFVGWHLLLAGHLLVNRERPGPAILKRMRRLMADHASLIVFPEGTRSRDGMVGPFRGGAFQLAIEAGADVVPVSIEGSGAVLPPAGFGVRPGLIRVRFGAPLATEGLQPEDRQLLARRAHADVTTLLAGHR